MVCLRKNYILVCISVGKVFSRLQFVVPEDLLQGVVLGKDGVIEIILSSLRARVCVCVCVCVCACTNVMYLQ